MAPGLGLSLQSLPPSFRALVLGSSGAIGSALEGMLAADPRCGSVVGLHRHSQPAIDYDDEESIGAAAEKVAAMGPFHLIINAAGVLHTAQFQPEKKLADLGYSQMLATFHANTFGPALVLRHFAGQLAVERSLLVFLSARVGSIDDNRLGGWYSYRASKAALNMLVKTASIELKRLRRNSVLVALHPGTVASNLSRPFRGDTIGRTPAVAAAQILTVLDGLTPTDTGKFLSYSGEEVPW